MADQVFSVHCGFWDAINYDRTYSADDMNKPYDRIVADGVFAANDGSPSSDLQVLATGNSMNITISRGQGIFWHKWFENRSPFFITVPPNTSLYRRIDSVLVQIDGRQSGRSGNIVYRTGTPAAIPEPPAINTEHNVLEYRLANIDIEESPVAIFQYDITDLRGTAECPWVTSLIQQVSTDTLWKQFQSAYEAQYNQYTTDYRQYVEEQRQAWEDFIASLTDDLTVTTSVVTLMSQYTATTDGVTNVPINISSYDPNEDVLQVFINGLYAAEGVDYELASDMVSIDLTDELDEGSVVVIVVFKSIIGGGTSSAVSLIQRLDSKIDSLFEDSGWIPLNLEDGISSAGTGLTPSVRAIGNRVYLRGSVVGVELARSTIASLPVSCKPDADITFISGAVTSLGTTIPLTITIKAASGNIIVGNWSSLSTSDKISIATNFLSAYSNNTSMIYRNCGSVANYNSLPTTGMVAGDVYMVEAGDPDHGISPGDYVMWNGAGWEVVTAVISSASIDAIISSIH